MGLEEKLVQARKLTLNTLNIDGLSFPDLFIRSCS